MNCYGIISLVVHGRQPIVVIWTLLLATRAVGTIVNSMYTEQIAWSKDCPMYIVQHLKKETKKMDMLK